ncbi:MAG: NADH-quinone oxidoreductase subunit C [Alphaproteobacteria bacterium]|nr:NADH-quinone oxidoreductase subunit C [Alphaproteobacteria bacterium]
MSMSFVPLAEGPGPHEIGAHIQNAMTDAVESYEVAHGELIVHVKREHILTVLTFLRDNKETQFTTLVDICGVDWPERANRFDVVYHLLSMKRNARVRLKVQTDEKTPVASAIDVFPCADWFEREAFDMYGVTFSGHPDLRRLLTDYGFQGFPLRKEFPLTGHVEVRYDAEQRRVVYEPVKLPAAYRNFDFESPWEGMQRVLPGDEKAGDED